MIRKDLHEIGELKKNTMLGTAFNRYSDLNGISHSSSYVNAYSMQPIQPLNQ